MSNRNRRRNGRRAGTVDPRVEAARINNNLRRNRYAVLADNPPNPNLAANPANPPNLPTVVDKYNVPNVTAPPAATAGKPGKSALRRFLELAMVAAAAGTVWAGKPFVEGKWASFATGTGGCIVDNTIGSFNDSCGEKIGSLNGTPCLAPNTTILGLNGTAMKSDKKTYAEMLPSINVTE